MQMRGREPEGEFVAGCAGSGIFAVAKQNPNALTAQTESNSKKAFPNETCAGTFQP
jgi:hypothetical protein